MAITLHKGDLPAALADTMIATGSVAIDTEALGLKQHRDRLCLVQISTGDSNAHLVQIGQGSVSAPHLARLLIHKDVEKLFHFARFDMALLRHSLAVMPAPVFCTKIASKLVRTYTDRHGLKDLCRELLDIDMSKAQQSSDWGAETLSPEQLSYAASDVLYLHQLQKKLKAMLIRENRIELARACFEFLPVRAELDLLGWPEDDIFAH